MDITPLRKDMIPDAAALFVHQFRALRQRLPVLPDRMHDPELIAEKLDYLTGACTAVAALEGGRLVGYLGWFVVGGFRGTERTAAYCPEWAHAAREGSKQPVYRALYRAASAEWAAAGCGVHAITLLAHDHEAERTWFWNGFGLAVVDAIRPLTPLGIPLPGGYAVRKATLDDVDLLAVLEAEHWQHYSQPPVFMAADEHQDAEGLATLISHPANSVWLAAQGDEAFGYMRFEGSSFGAADVVNAETTVAITGAYTRPAYRGRRVAVALLDAALHDHTQRGFARCSVDFESFNPEAAAFWMTYFEPACFSLMRVPEHVTRPAGK